MPNPNPSTFDQEVFRDWLIVAVASILLLLLMVCVFFFIVWKKNVEKAEKRENKEETLPNALLEDIDGVTGQPTHKITKKITKIGRVGQNDEIDKSSVLDIGIPQSTVSALHATIEYKDPDFFLVDQRSTNSTYLNGHRITGKVRLKGGDKIVFDQYKFRFVLPGLEERGGTILNPQPGRAILRVAPPPEKALLSKSPEGIHEEDANPDPYKPGPQDDQAPHPTKEKRITIKPGSCPNHPSYKATELCSNCGEAYCVNCMKEEDGRKICSDCAGWY